MPDNSTPEPISSGHLYTLHFVTLQRYITQWGVGLRHRISRARTTDGDNHLSRTAYEFTRMDASSHRIYGSGGVGRAKYGPGIRMDTGDALTSTVNSAY